MKVKKYIWLSVIPVAFFLSSCSILQVFETYKVEMSVGGEIVADGEFEYGDYIEAYSYEDNAKKGYIIDTWYKDPYFTEEWDFSNDYVSEDMVLYGKEPHKVNYYDGYKIIGDEYVKDGGHCTYMPIIDKDGYDLKGWFQDISCTDEYDFASHVYNDMNLYVKLVKHPYNRLTVSYYNSKNDMDALYRDQDLNMYDFIISAYYGDEVYDIIEIDDSKLTYEIMDSNNYSDKLEVVFSYEDISTSYFIDIIDNKCTKFEIQKDGDKNSFESFDILNPDFSAYEYTMDYNYGPSKTITSKDLDFKLEASTSEKATYGVYDKKGNKMGVIYVVQQLYTDISKFNYSLNINDEIEIYGLKVNTERLSNIFINDYYYINDKKYTVAVIGNGAFKNDHVLKEIGLPKTLKVIGNNAFEGNDKLEVVNYEGEGLNIQNEAFKNCISLKNSSIIEKSKKIGNGAFENCVNITLPVFNSKIENIGAEAFLGCSSITEIDLNNIKTIGASAFEGCTSLSKVSMPHIAEIGDKAFAQTKVEKIKIPEQTKIGKTIFENNTSVVNLDIGSSLTLKDLFGAFIPTSIQSITLHNPVEKQLEGLANLNELTLYNYNDKTIGSIFSSSELGNTYEVIQGTGTYYLPKNLEKVSIDSKSLGDFAFANCNSIKEINFLNQQPTIIPDNAFFNCLALKTTNIDFTKVTEIGNNAFQHCNNLIGDLKLDVVTVVGENAFEGTLFKNIYIDKDCALIGNNAFYNMDNLETIDVNIENNVYFTKYNCLYEKTAPNKYILVKCPNLTNIVPKVINGTVEIKANAFYECKQDMLILETIFYPVIDKDAFKDSSLVRITAYNVMKDTFEGNSINNIHVYFQNVDYDRISVYLLDSKENEISNIIKLDANNTFKFDFNNLDVLEMFDYKGNKIAFTKQEDGSIKIDEKLSRDLILKCTFERKKYKITYQYDGKEEYQMVGFGLNIEYKEGPAKEDYEFVKWVDVSTEETYDIMPGNDITLAPRYKKVNFQAKFIYPDETEVVSKIKAGDKISLPEDPVKENYDFVGWIDKTSGETYKVMPEKDIILVPKWAKSFITITYEFDDGQTQDFNVKRGSFIDYPNPGTKENYVFINWIDKYTGEYYEKAPNDDVVLIASWKYIYVTIKFVTNSVEQVPEIKVKYTDTNIDLPVMIPETGIQFLGWTFDLSSNESPMLVLPNVEIDKNITLYAVYDGFIINCLSSETYKINLYRDNEIIKTYTINPSDIVFLDGELLPYLSSNGYNRFSDYYIKTSNGKVKIENDFDILSDLDIHTSWLTPFGQTILEGEMSAYEMYYYDSFNPTFSSKYIMGTDSIYPISVTVTDNYYMEKTSTIQKDLQFLEFDTDTDSSYKFSFNFVGSVYGSIPVKFYIFESYSILRNDIRIYNTQEINEKVFIKFGESFRLPIPNFDPKIYKFEGYFIKNGEEYEQITDNKGNSIKTFSSAITLDVVARYSII